MTENRPEKQISNYTETGITEWFPGSWVHEVRCSAMVVGDHRNICGGGLYILGVQVGRP